jgi:hypothetical protein
MKKRKIMALEAAALILGTILLSSTSAQTIQEESATNENIINLEYEAACFGSIYGTTGYIYGPMVGVAALCGITVYSEDADIYRFCISWGIYKIENLPLGYTYTVTAAHYLNETVTLTSDEPHAQVDFTFYEDDVAKPYSKPIFNIQNIRARLLSKLFSFFLSQLT